MKLEDATKEELVWWIKNNAFSLYFNEHRFESDILFRRSSQSIERSHAAGERCSAALVKYTDLLEPYLGRPLTEIPDHVIKKGAALEREMKAASKEQDTAHKEWERLNRKIDALMSRKDAVRD